MGVIVIAATAAVAATDIGIIIVIKSYYLSTDPVYVVFVRYIIRVVLHHYVSN